MFFVAKSIFSFVKTRPLLKLCSYAFSLHRCKPFRDRSLCQNVSVVDSVLIMAPTARNAHMRRWWVVRYERRRRLPSQFSRSLSFICRLHSTPLPPSLPPSPPVPPVQLLKPFPVSRHSRHPCPSSPLHFCFVFSPSLLRSSSQELLQ